MADTVPSTFSAAADNALAGMNAPAAPAPVYQAPAPAAEPTFFGRILQGALNGLAGGLRSGQENIAGAGTPGYRPNGNGLGYAEQLQQQQDAQKQAAQAQKVQASQQDFENQQKTFQANQQAQLQKVQMVQANLHAIDLQQQIHHADETAQNEYYKGQEDQRQAFRDSGGKVVAHLKVAPGQNMHDVGASYLKDNQNTLQDAHLTFARDADGETEVLVMSGDPNSEITAEHANSQLKAIGSDSQIAPGTTMRRQDFTRKFGEESGKVAAQHNAMKMEQLKSADLLRNSLTEEGARARDAQALESQKEAASNLQGGSDADPTKPLDKTLETLVDAVHDGHSTPSMVTKGMGTKAVAGNRAMQARYEAKYMDPKSPDYDPKAQTWQAAEGNFKAAYNDKNTQTVQTAGELYGTQDPRTGKVISEGAVTAMKNKMAHLQAEHPTLFGTGPTARAAMGVLHVAGNDVAEDIMANAPEVALAAAKFASGGNPSSDATYKATVAAIERARTPEALKKVFEGIDDTAGNRIAGLRQGNPALGNRLSGVKDPGTRNDSNNQAVDSKNPSGQDIPKGMKLQRNRKTGATRLVPE